MALKPPRTSLLLSYTPPACVLCSWWRKTWRGFWWGFYIRLYASIHSVLVAFLPGTNSWPFKPDKPYFRFITSIQLVGGCLCCLMILFGVLGATNQSPCNKGNKSCDQCFRYVSCCVMHDWWLWALRTSLLPHYLSCLCPRLASYLRAGGHVPGHQLIGLRGAAAEGPDLRGQLQHLTKCHVRNWGLSGQRPGLLRQRHQLLWDPLWALSCAGAVGLQGG